MKPLLIVDAANVVGSVPDGWWRDRVAATQRLRDALAARADAHDVVLVVEGQARGVASIEGVRVVAAPGSGDDAIVALVRDEWVGARGCAGACTVATADRDLARRVRDLGAEVIGPRSVR
jgi:rRNA-processing protein FCF1